MNTMKGLVCLSFTAILFFMGCAGDTQKQKQKKTNVVIIFLDDSSYGDFNPFSDKAPVPTPHVDKLAKSGTAFTNFYVPQAICSASRAALQTGCYPSRVEVYGAHGPRERGLDTLYNTMGEVFQAGGYKTAAFGKWHLGDQEDTRSHARGYGESCGLMYSNDMWQHHPVMPEYWGRFPLQYWENGKVTIEEVEAKHQKMLTRWFTEKSVDFIRRHQQEPFFLYLAHAMPHVPLFCSEEFEGKSGKGLYGDVIMELDWSVGEVMKTLEEEGLRDNTLVIFTSDNGPWAVYGDHAGYTPFRAHKATSFDGGVRSAMVMSYPGYIKENEVSDVTFCSIDLLPTLCEITGVAMPDSPIDGHNVWPLLCMDTTFAHPHEYYFITVGRNLEAVISADGRWKLHLPHNYLKVIEGGKDGLPGKEERTAVALSLFDMHKDPCETTNVVNAHPAVVKKMMAAAEAYTESFSMKDEEETRS